MGGRCCFGGPSARRRGSYETVETAINMMFRLDMEDNIDQYGMVSMKGSVKEERTNRAYVFTILKWQ